VTYKPKNKPVVFGTVMVMGSDGRPYYGEIKKDGSYTIENVPSGTVKVTVNSPDPRANTGPTRQEPGAMPGKPTAGAAAAPGGPTPPSVPDDIVKAWFPIPDKYGDVTSSGLKTDVKRGDSTFNIELPD
jgi:hypothetical protein